MPIITNNNAGVTTVGVPGQTFTKELQMFGQTALSAYVGSYQETSLTRPVWTCDAPAQLIGVYDRHSVLGSTQIMILKAAGSTPLGSGAPVLSAAFGGTGAVDVTVSATLYNSTALQQYAVGDQCGVQWSIVGAKPPTGIITLVLQRL